MQNFILNKIRKLQQKLKWQYVKKAGMISKKIEGNPIDEEKVKAESKEENTI